MLETVFGSRNKERILIYIAARGEGYAREISRYFEAGLSPIQSQLEKLEAGNLLYSKPVGKTLVYAFNPRYPFLTELKNLLEKAIQFLPESDREKLQLVRKRPRRKGKPLWNQLMKFEKIRNRLI